MFKTSRMKPFSVCMQLLILVNIQAKSRAESPSCSAAQLQSCVKKADSLLQNPDSVFPDTPAAVDKLCGTWKDFTRCIQQYTKECLSAKQKIEFDKSFKDPVASMSILCTETPFRKEYLYYAPCIKQVANEDRNCGFQYRSLIKYMADTSTHVRSLCCARSKFQTCVLSKTRTKCDKELAENQIAQEDGLMRRNATAFAALALSKSLGSVPQQCQHVSFNDNDCPLEDSRGSAAVVTQATGGGGQFSHAAPKPTPVVAFRKTSTRHPPAPKNRKMSENSAPFLYNSKLSFLGLGLTIVTLLA